MAEHNSFITLTDECGEETTYYSVVYEGFPEKFKKKAESRLNETDELIAQSIQELKDYMQEEKFNPVDEQYLLATLRLHKYNMEKTKEKLKNFLIKRQEVIKMLVEIDEETIGNILDEMSFGVFPYRDENGSVLFFNRANGMDPNKYKSRDIGAVLMAFYLFLMKFPISSVGGFTYFGDAEGIVYYIPFILKEIMNFMFILFSFPMRAGRIHVFNESALARLIPQIASPFVDSRVLDMVNWHGDSFTDLDDYYDLNMLPEEFGGKLGKLSNAPYKQKLLDFIKELKQENI